MESKQFPISKCKKPTTGRLWYKGKVIVDNKPFNILQSRKKEMLLNGYCKDYFDITY